MKNNTKVLAGEALPPDREEAQRQRLRETYADEAEQAVEVIRKKLAGIQQALETAEAEAERLRAEAREGGQ